MSAVTYHIYDFMANVPAGTLASLSGGHQSRLCNLQFIQSTARMLALIFVKGPIKCAITASSADNTHLKAQVSGTFSGTFAPVLYDRVGIILKLRLGAHGSSVG
jgi:hypothetical protein